MSENPEKPDYIPAVIVIVVFIIIVYFLKN